jgi:hypothetical protein
MRRLPGTWKLSILCVLSGVKATGGGPDQVTTIFQGLLPVPRNYR